MGLAEERSRYSPPLPNILKQSLVSKLLDRESPKPEELKGYFPRTLGQPFLSFEPGKGASESLRIGVVFSGGQAAGGHNVISGLFDTLPPGSRLIGFLDGPEGIIENRFIELTGEKIAPYRNRGGFDMLGSGRTKIETPDQFEKALKAASDLDGLVIIGGDDSNTNAALLAEYFLSKGCKTCVVGVPKTIDGDLQSEDLEISFGFDTATKIYSEMIGNVLCDAISAKKYFFFIKVMGRTASHLALECALNTHVNMTLIGEEIAAKKLSFSEVVGQIADLVALRASLNKNYGVILIPEGIIEFIPDFKEVLGEKKLDPHGNIKVSQIESERFFIHAVKEELGRRGSKIQFNPQPLFYGYEGRCGYPTDFDSQYCYALGHVASLLIKEKRTGYMACVKNLKEPVEKWDILGIPLTTMMHIEERKGQLIPVIKKTLVDLKGEKFMAFAANRARWMVEDDYLYPGPIQFGCRASL